MKMFFLMQQNFKRLLIFLVVEHVAYLQLDSYYKVEEDRSEM